MKLGNKWSSERKEIEKEEKRKLYLLKKMRAMRSRLKFKSALMSSKTRISSRRALIMRSGGRPWRSRTLWAVLNTSVSRSR
jgi:hypothetical protein